MLRFFLFCLVLVSTSGALAQKSKYPAPVNRMPVPANGIQPELVINERQSNIRLLVDSLRNWQNRTGAKDQKLQYKQEKLSTTRFPLSTPNKSTTSAPNNRSTSAICYDTSSRFFIDNDSYRLYAHQVCETADGNLLVSGEYLTQSPPYLWGGFLMKCDEYGNTLWARQYDSTDHVGFSYINYSRVIELKDGSVVMAGRTNNLITGNNDLIVTKTDNMGFVQWSRVYKSRLWGHGDGSSSYYVLEDLKQDPYSSDIFISGGFWKAGKSIIRINQSDGKIVWSNLYQYYNSGYQVFDNSFGMTFEPNEVRLFGKLTLGHTLISVHRINKTNGDTLSAKLFTVKDPLDHKLEFLSCENVTVLDNGNYVLSGECYDDYPLNYDPPTRPLHHTAVCELDRNLNFVRAYSLKSQLQSNVYDTRITVFPDGSGLFTMREWHSSYNANFYYVQFKDGFITRQRKKAYVNEGIAFETNAMRLKGGGDLLIRPIEDSLQTYSRIEFLKLHTSDISSTCLGVDDTSTSTYFFEYVPAFWPLDSIGRNVFQENPNKTITENTFNTEPLAGCYQVSHCDSLKLIAPVTTVCLGEDLAVIARKNEGCGTIVPFSFDHSVADAVRDNDSTIRFQFKVPWSGYLYASLQGCSLMKDSVYVTVLKAPLTLNLGPDSTICPGNTILLNAHAGYATYTWQDGSHDSTFIVRTPGVYYVETTNGCGTTYTDTILVNAHPPIPFDLGSDRTKCNSDTLHINAPSGFLNYTWGNNYNISSTTSQMVVVNPLVDTAYYIRAEKTPGCFAYDTVRVRVNHSPAIDLGRDKSFCSGDSAVFTAGTGFNQYLWSNGHTSQQITVKTPGTYSVTGTTTQGCKSYDTVMVLSVFTNPIVRLDHNNTLCTGTSRTLDAGPFSSYKWTNGSSTRTLSVNHTGTYAVEVQDANGCKGSDTTVITEFLPLPENFLPDDTAICSYGSLTLKPTHTYTSYLWSNNATASSITITQPGEYRLKVEDINGCKGSDTIRVHPKDCMQGFYIPTAFTPDGDGKNDLFRPLLFGQVKKYSFTIYNRWGQVVFQTSELAKGWYGIFAGTKQDSNVFAWTCTYQLEGQEVKTEKGTVVLIR